MSLLDQDPLREEAECQARFLEKGLASVAEVVAWVDMQIERLPKPDIALCEAALMGRSYEQDLASKLRELPGTFIEEAVEQKVIVRLLEVSLWELETEGVGALDRVVLRIDGHPDWAMRYDFCADYELELIDQKIISKTRKEYLEELCADFRDQLEQR